MTYTAACSGVLDVAFVLHSGGTVQPLRWHYITQFVVSIVNSLDVGLGRTRVAVVTWSDSAHLAFTLDRFDSRQDVVQVNDLLCFYTTIIRPVLEYACPVWHSSLTTAQAKSLESIQRRAMRVIFQDDNYTLLLILAGVDTLESRRDQLTKRFFTRSVLPESSCLHY